MDDAIKQVLAEHLVRYGLVGGFALAIAGVVVSTQLASVAVRSALFFITLGSFGLAVVPLAASDAGLESAGASVSGGFDVTDPSAARAGTGGSTRLKAMFVFAGAGTFALAGFLGLGWL